MAARRLVTTAWAAALARREAAGPSPARLSSIRWASSSSSTSSSSSFFADAAEDAATNVDASHGDDARGGGHRLAFVDRVHCTAVGGTGGAGCAAFWRSRASGRYGPPDGGNGGRGGDVVIEAVASLKSLRGIRPSQRAGAGKSGGPQKMHGPRGVDCVVGVPPGTVVYEVVGGGGGGGASALDDESGEEWWGGGGGAAAGEGTPPSPPPPTHPSLDGLRLVADLARPGDRYVAAAGGAGGTGNAAAPKSAERARRKAAADHPAGLIAPAPALAGVPGAAAHLRLELRSLADAGLVGPPNAGKSTLLRALSGARPKVGAYPFTTTRPHLGVITAGRGVAGSGGTSSSSSSPAAAAAAQAAADAALAPPLTLADVPGLLPGAAAGAGLGHDFLRHVSRCAALVLVLDVSPPALPSGKAADPVAAMEALLGELGAYDPTLPTRPAVIAANKADACLDGGAAAVAALQSAAPAGCVAVIATSGRTGVGVKELAGAVREAVGRAADA